MAVFRHLLAASLAWELLRLAFAASIARPSGTCGVGQMGGSAALSCSWRDSDLTGGLIKFEVQPKDDNAGEETH